MAKALLPYTRRIAKSAYVYNLLNSGIPKKKVIYVVNDLFLRCSSGWARTSDPLINSQML